MDWLDLKEATAPSALSGAPNADAVAESQLLEGLNDAQREAVLAGSGPLLIVAGPGSGKTRVVTTRIAHLVTQRGIAPWEILAITFTNKAAKEMRERVDRLIPPPEAEQGRGGGSWIGTFHSMCARILRREIDVLEGYTRDFSIHDTGDRNNLIKTIVKDLGFDPKQFRAPQIGSWISARKNRRGRDDGFELSDGSMEEDVFLAVEKKYRERMRQQNALDFDDLLLKVLEIFDHHHGVRDAYARRFRQVLVDEYQDTNRVQYRLVKHFASFHGNLTVCGDPDQSIYAWRGADIRNILDFEEDYPGAQTVRLEQNYRSTGRILEAANAVISNNTARKDKDLFTDGEQGERVVVIECGDENDEAREIAAQIRSHVARGGNYGDCAVLYRAGFLQRAIEAALRYDAVPYQVVAGLEFYQRKEIKDLVALLRLALNPADDVAFVRVVNTPARGVGDTSLARLAHFAQERGLSMANALGEADALNEIRGRAKKGLAEFAGALEELALARELDAAVALDVVLESLDVDRWLAEMDDGSGTADRAANVEEFRAFASDYDERSPEGKLRGFLEEVALVSDTDAYEGDEDRVKLMTLHACKGLEFRFVAIAGVEDELLPHERAVDEAADPDVAIEEERRLFYVGITRAKERLLVTYTTYRSFFGGGRPVLPSRYLRELPEAEIEGVGPEEREEEALGAFDPAKGAGAGLEVGAIVMHPHFGRGKIEQLTGAGINARATVDFVREGRKQLLLQYASLERLDR
ncbi:ATP-dependent DNA helicase PcrA [Planctomycetes bacterium Poly30]|uniref:DNA 3'-5' helicase n=1 Tax=Saltatorellus ferox TaxID=2528018 RepID=A0A518EQ76_9BACT|nr:ATP-dependent DNA helicase PcrA [Planctomycetes bacterium Poly30]